MSPSPVAIATTAPDSLRDAIDLAPATQFFFATLEPVRGTGVYDRCQPRRRLLGSTCLLIAGARYPKGPG